MMTPDLDQLITVGRIGAAFGVRGWLRVHSFTTPPDALFNYQPWYIKTRQGLRQIVVREWQDQAKGPVASLEGYNDPESARELSRLEILVDKSVLPTLDAGDYYWHQLEGLRVISEYEGQRLDLGNVDSLLETGANDVLVVKGTGQRERLIPYLPERVVKEVNLLAGTITVEWDPEF